MSERTQRRSSEYSNSNDGEVSQKNPVKRINDEQKKAAKSKIYKILYSNWMAWVSTISSLALGATPMLMFSVFGSLINSFSTEEDIMKSVKKSVIVHHCHGLAQIFGCVFLDQARITIIHKNHKKSSSIQ